MTTQQRLQSYLDAEKNILASGQDVMFNGRRVTRADLKEIQAEIALLRRALASEQRAAAGQGGPRFSVADFS